jgi:hypothetical protein
VVCVCVCFYLTSGFAWPVRPRDAGPGADHRTGRAELPIYIHTKHVLYIYTYDTTVYPTSGASKLMGLSHLSIKIKLGLIEKKKKKKKPEKGCQSPVVSRGRGGCGGETVEKYPDSVSHRSILLAPSGVASTSCTLRAPQGPLAALLPSRQ